MDGPEAIRDIGPAPREVCPQGFADGERAGERRIAPADDIALDAPLALLLEAVAVDDHGPVGQQAGDGDGRSQMLLNDDDVAAESFEPPATAAPCRSSDRHDLRESGDSRCRGRDRRSRAQAANVVRSWELWRTISRTQRSIELAACLLKEECLGNRCSTFISRTEILSRLNESPTNKSDSILESRGLSRAFARRGKARDNAICTITSPGEGRGSRADGIGLNQG